MVCADEAQQTTELRTVICRSPRVAQLNRRTHFKLHVKHRSRNHTRRNSAFATSGTTFLVPSEETVAIPLTYRPTTPTKVCYKPSGLDANASGTALAAGEGENSQNTMINTHGGEGKWGRKREGKGVRNRFYGQRLVWACRVRGW